MTNIVIFEDEARKRLLAGAKELYDAVSTTFGPKGRNVVIDRPFIGPVATHDGVTVSKSIEIDDTGKNREGYKTGADMIRKAAQAMNDEVGDGTTTVTVLVYHMLNELTKVIDNQGNNPMLVRKELVHILEDIVKPSLRELTTKIGSNSEQLSSIAKISAADEELGELIAAIVDQVGPNGTVTIEDSSEEKDSYELVNGYEFPQGFVVPHMATNPEHTKAILEEVPVLITDKKISYLTDLQDIMNKLLANGQRELVVICDDIEGEALQFIVHNIAQRVMKVVVIKAPGVGDAKIEFLNDISKVTGATVISKDAGYSLKEATELQLGKADKIIAAKNKTTILNKETAAVDEWAKVLQKRLQEDSDMSKHQKEQLIARISALEGRVATIKVAGKTPQDIEEKKFRVEDAVAAAKAALDEGIVPGGAATLLAIGEEVMAKCNPTGFRSVYMAVREALQQPFLKLCENAGLNGMALIDKVMESEAGYGIDVSKDDAKIVNLVEEGIIDPAKATRQALETAFSVVGLAITTGALVIEKPEKK